MAVVTTAITTKIEKTSFEMSPERMAAIAGDWLIEGPGVSLPITYSVEDGQMFAQAAGQPRFRVTPTSDSTFDFVGVEASVTFHFADDGTVDTATHHQGGDAPMRRVAEVELTPEQLEAYAGRYFSRELEVFYDLRIVDGELTAHRIRMEPFALEHVSGDDFSGPSFFASVSFRRAGNGAITGFTVANGRTKGVVFERQ